MTNKAFLILLCCLIFSSSCTRKSLIDTDKKYSEAINRINQTHQNSDNLLKETE